MMAARNFGMYCGQPRNKGERKMAYQFGIRGERNEFVLCSKEVKSQRKETLCTNRLWEHR